MTTPNPPAPGAPGDPAPNTPPAPGAPAPAPTGTPAPGPGLDPNAPIDFASLPLNVQNYITQLRQENGGQRQGKAAAVTEANEAKQRLEAVLGALGLNPDGTAAPVDPAVAAAELAERAEQAEMRAWGASVRLEVTRLAGKYGADADALLDSQAFADSLEDLYQSDLDPSSMEFRTALGTKITNAVAQNPNVRARAAGPVRQGADITPSGGGAEGRPKNLREAFARQAAT